MCYSGQWQIIGDVTNTNQIIISSNTLITGDFSQNPDSTLVVTNGSTLVILGTASLDGTLIVNINNTTGLIPILTATTIIGNFSTINVTNVNNNKCFKHDIIQNSNSLSILLTTNNCNKSKNYITTVVIVVSVIVPIILLIVIIILIYTFHTKFVPIFGYIKDDNYFR